MAQLDLDLIRHALSVAQANGFAEVELELGDDSFTAKLSPARKAAPAPVTTSAEVASEPVDTTTPVKATLVGYYRESKTPLQVGMTVNKGDVVAILGALGIANDIEAPVSGEVVEVLVEPNQAVEFGQVIARIKT